MRIQVLGYVVVYDCLVHSDCTDPVGPAPARCPMCGRVFLVSATCVSSQVEAKRRVHKFVSEVSITGYISV